MNFTGILLVQCWCNPDKAQPRFDPALQIPGNAGKIRQQRITRNLHGQIYHPTTKKRQVQLGLVIVGALLIVGMIWGIHLTQIPPSQPIQFPHSMHVSLGIQCLYCHPGALRGPSPGLPTESKCWGCHQQITVRNSEIDKLVSYVKADKPIQWVPVALLPDFVYFSHRPHIAAGLNCEDCHGEISQMTVAVPQKMKHGLVSQLSQVPL